MGLMLSSMACYDPRYAPQLWKDWGIHDDDSGGLEFLRTHPAAPHRADSLAGLVEQALEVHACASCPRLVGLDSS